MGMSFYRHCVRPNLHLSSSAAPRRKLGRQRRVLMLILHRTCLMPLAMHVVDPWGDVLIFVVGSWWSCTVL